MALVHTRIPRRSLFSSMTEPKTKPGGAQPGGAQLGGAEPRTTWCLTVPAALENHLETCWRLSGAAWLGAGGPSSGERVLLLVSC